MNFKPSNYQLEIFEEVKNGNRHIVVDAVAGSGKTVTIIESLKYIDSNKDIAFVAFNKHIATTLQAKAPDYVQVMTLHSMGLKSITEALGRTKVKTSKMFDIVKQLNEEVYFRYTFDQKKNATGIVMKIVGLLKGSLLEPTEDNIDAIANKHSMNIPTDFPIYEMIGKAMRASENTKFGIDFDDMIYMPTAMKLNCKKYDVIVVDECLPSRSRVLLSNGEERTISEIVKNRLPLEVMTYNTDSGEQEAKSIVGWSEKPTNDKRMMEIVFAEKHKISGRGNGYHPDHNLFCTDNHLILTFERGFVPADQVEVGEHVQFENAHGNKMLRNINGEIYSSTPSGKATCDKCGLVCNSASALGSHMRIHAPTKTYNNMSAHGSKVLADMAIQRNRDPLIRGKVAKTLSAKMLSGEIPSKFGGYIGNGFYTKQQIKLHDELLKHDERWELEYPISTGYSFMDDEGYPSNYKLDIAFPDHKLGVEIHGGGHRKSKQIDIDRKKQNLLTSKGWLVVEIWNDEIDMCLEDVVDNVLSALICRSPSWLEVRSVKEIEYSEEYVYDIEVEDNHNFYAEGVLVHNCQDLNPAQVELILKSLKKNGRVIAVGDPYQSLYGFRGADTEAMPKLIKRLNAKVMPLSISYRCPTSHVKLAQTIVPEIEAAENAEEGRIIDIKEDELCEVISPNDLCICRFNAPLVRPAFDLLRSGIKVCIRGKDIGTGLTKLIKGFGTNNIDEMVKKFYTWTSKEIAKAEKKGLSTDPIEDKYDTIMAFADMADARNVAELIMHIEDIFDDKRAQVTFSSVHRAKGLEADNVFIIKPSAMPSRRASKDWEIRQEQNIRYVAFTRAKDVLYMVE